MHRDVHRYLDGEIGRDRLGSEALAELAEWEALQAPLHARRAVRAPVGLDENVMRAIAAEAPAPAPVPQGGGSGGWRAAWAWLMTPRPMSVRPLTPLAAACGMVLVLVLAQSSARTVGPTPTQIANAPLVYVQFALKADGARSVAVAGDFNGWSADTGALRDTNGDGVWSGLVAVQPGVHKYMFVVDGEEWVTDPSAEGYVDDGFGMQNALLAVASPAAL